VTRSIGVSRHLCRVSAAWGGWIDENGDRRLLTDIGHDRITPDVFPGRWNPTRSFPEELEPLPRVAGQALERAGCWREGTGSVCSGGVIVGADGGFLGPSARFAHQIAARYSANISPSDFIHSLPSTAASLLAKLYGLSDYQATLVQGPFSGVLALGHALDLMAVGRLARALVATLSVSASAVPGEGQPSMARIAVALCLESASGELGQEVELEVRRTGLARREAAWGNWDDESLSRALHPFGALAALPLVRLAMALDGRRGPCEIESPADCHGERVYVSVRGWDSQNG